MEKVKVLLGESIVTLTKVENEIKKLSTQEYEQIAEAYPFNQFFHELIDQLNPWKSQIEREK